MLRWLRNFMALRTRPETRHLAWYKVRDVKADESAPTDAQRTATHAAAYTHKFPVPVGVDRIELRFSCSNTDKTSTFYGYGCRILDVSDRDPGDPDDMAPACQAGLRSGLQVSKDGLYYADTITVTDRWLKDVRVGDGRGGNGMGRLAIDWLGYAFLIAIIENADATDWWRLEISGF
jgi:hypothetical protein